MYRSTLPYACGAFAMLILLVALSALSLAHPFSDSIYSLSSYNIVVGDAAVGSSKDSSSSGPRWVTASLTSLPSLACHKAVVVERGAAETLCAIGGDSRDAYCYPLDALGTPANAGGGLAYSLAEPLSYHATVVISNYTYVLGGYIRSSNSQRGDVYCIPPDVQGDIAPTNVMPQPIDQHAAVAVGNRVYVIGGYDDPHRSYLSDVWSTDIVTNCPPRNSLKWDTRSSLPTGIAGHAAASVVLDNGEKFIYVIGGLTGSPGPHSTLTNTVRYTKVMSNGELSKWVNLGPVTGTLGNETITMPGAWMLTAAVSGRYLYVMGGTPSKSDPFIPLTNTYRARIQDDGALEWLALPASLPIPLHSHAAAVSRYGNLYVVAGISSTGPQNQVYYTPLLDFEKRDTPPHGPARYGDTITYTLKLTNLGVRDFVTLTITDTVRSPVAADFAFHDPTGTCPGRVGTDTITCSIPSLALDATKELTFQVTISQPILSPPLSWEPSEEKGGHTPVSPESDDCSNLSSLENIEPLLVVAPRGDLLRCMATGCLADLSLSKNRSLDQVIAGTNVTYTLVVTNTGPSDASDVLVVDRLPSGTRYVTATPPAVNGTGVVTWQLGTLRSGYSETLRLAVQVSASVTGCLLNIAGVASGIPDGNPINNTGIDCTLIDTRSDMSITKQGYPSKVAWGDALTYTLLITNNGPSDAYGVVVTDTLPEGFTFSSSLPSSNGSGSLIWHSSTLRAGDSWAIIVMGSANSSASGLLIDTAAVGSNVSDDDLSNNHDQVLTEAPVPVVNKAYVCENGLWCQESNTVINSQFSVYLPVVFKDK